MYIEGNNYNNIVIDRNDNIIAGVVERERYTRRFKALSPWFPQEHNGRMDLPGGSRHYGALWVDVSLRYQSA